jgi:LysR family hydrogen peroxide-inducible transcriptional activator
VTNRHDPKIGALDKSIQRVIIVSVIVFIDQTRSLMRPLPTLRQVAYLIALDRYRHFGRAADACFVTQSTLSAGLQELEAVLRVTLVERTKRRVHLTPLGRVIVARGRELVVMAEEMVDLARSAGAPLGGPLRLGVIPTIGPFLLPALLPGLRREFPQLRLFLREDLSARLLDQLESGDLDAVILALPYAGDLELAELGHDPFLLVCPPDHRLAACDRVAPADLPEGELILLEDGHCLTSHALAACRLGTPGLGRGAGSRAAIHGTSLHTIVQMVAGGLGLTLLPRLAVDAGILGGTGLVARPLVSAGVRTLALGWRRSAPRPEEFRLLADRVTEMLARAASSGT